MKNEIEKVAKRGKYEMKDGGYRSGIFYDFVTTEERDAKV